MIDELIDAVARGGSLSREQAAGAVGTMFRFMAARLPSPLFGELQAHLHPLAHAGGAHAPVHGPATP